MKRLLGADPSGDLRPMISQRIRSHKQPDMTAGHNFLNDTVLRRADIIGGIENLLGRRNVIVGACQQIGEQVMSWRSILRPRRMNSPLARRFSLKIWLITWRYQRRVDNRGTDWIEAVSHLEQEFVASPLLPQFDFLQDARGRDIFSIGAMTSAVPVTTSSPF
jgi:hypothetical protein